VKIGIIGIGFLGAPVAKHLVAAGHHVKVTNTRQPEELARMAREQGASPALLQEVGQDVDVLISSLNLNVLAASPQDLKDLFQSLPADVIVADTGNYIPFQDGRIEAQEQGPVEGLWVAEQLGRPVTKFLNNLLAETIVEGGTPAGPFGRIALAPAGDDQRAKQVLTALSNDLGFDAVDAGSPAESWASAARHAGRPHRADGRGADRCPGQQGSDGPGARAYHKRDVPAARTRTREVIVATERTALHNAKQHVLRA
jgi:predicted dinucleotide-binding enzyme